MVELTTYRLNTKHATSQSKKIPHVTRWFYVFQALNVHIPNTQQLQEL